MRYALQVLTGDVMVLIALAIIILSYLIVMRMFIRDWLVMQNKLTKRIWTIKEQPLSEGVMGRDNDEVMVDENEDKGKLEESEEPITPEEEVAFKKLELLGTEIEHLFSEGDKERQELLSDLAKIIRTYTELNKRPYRTAINNLIIRRAQQECQLTITQTEAENLWPPA